jgi:hypothetical protein
MAMGNLYRVLHAQQHNQSCRRLMKTLQIHWVKRLLLVLSEVHLYDVQKIRLKMYAFITDVRLLFLSSCYFYLLVTYRWHTEKCSILSKTYCYLSWNSNKNAKFFSGSVSGTFRVRTHADWILWFNWKAFVESLTCRW